MFLNIVKRSMIVAIIIALPIFILNRPKSSPEVVETSPKNFSQEVPIDLEVVKFSFNRPMDNNRISYVIKSGTWPEHEEKWDDDHKTLSIFLKEELAPRQTYAIALNKGVEPTLASQINMRDKSGNMLQSYSLVFVTGSTLKDQMQADKSLDTDKDGLEDSLEIRIGTDINRSDTDQDGLSDYQEYCKYRTNAAALDSDGDGIPDSDWDERREYAHTLKATCQLKPPVDIHAMNDLFQDAKQINEDTFEVVLYLDSKPRLLHNLRYTANHEIPVEYEKYLRPSFSVNYSRSMQNYITKRISKCEMAWDALNWIQKELGKMKVVPLTVGILDFRYIDGKVVFVDSTDKDNENALNKSLKSHLKETYYANSMFKKKQFSTCASRATLRAGMLRAAGFPTKLAFAVPLLYSTEEEKEDLIKGIQSNFLKESLYLANKAGCLLKVDHSYNEIYVNNHWIRVDYAINDGVLFGNTRPFIKILSLTDWSEVDFTETWDIQKWPDDRPYKTLSVSEQFPVHLSEYAVGL